MAYSISGVLILMTSAVHSVYSFQSIPALFWSAERPASLLPEMSGVNLINSDDLLSYLIPFMDNSSDCSVVYLQDKLHLDDFTRFADVYSLNSEGGAFKNLKGLMEEHYSKEFLHVANPSAAVEKLKAKFSGDVHMIKSSKEVEALNLDKDKKVLLIVHLNPTSGQVDQENAIKQNDAMIGAISRHLQKRSKNYSALFTAQSAPAHQADNIETFSNRHLLAESVAESNPNGTFLNVSNGQIYIFLKEAYVVVKKDNNIFLSLNLTVNGSIADSSSRDNLTAEIRLEFNKTEHNGTFYDVAIITEARNKQDRWVIERMTLNIEGGVQPNTNISLQNVTLSRGDMDFTIPILYSWHCTNMVMFVDTHQLNESEKMFLGTYINLRGYQIQPFSIQKNRFFDAQDCVPYFTTAIWMFLFSAIFLISILIFGVLMVLSLSTMDKYDDPKGKTITVAQGTD